MLKHWAYLVWNTTVYCIPFISSLVNIILRNWDRDKLERIMSWRENILFNYWDRWLHGSSEIISKRTAFQWMENDIIPFWLFLNDTDRILDVEDDEYFDEYMDYYSRLKSHQRFDKVMFYILLFLNLCQLLVLYFLSYMIRDPRIRPSEARPWTNRERSWGGLYW